MKNWNYISNFVFFNSTLLFSSSSSVIFLNKISLIVDLISFLSSIISNAFEKFPSSISSYLSTPLSDFFK